MRRLPAPESNSRSASRSRPPRSAVSARSAKLLRHSATVFAVSVSHGCVAAGSPPRNCATRRSMIVKARSYGARKLTSR